MKSIWLLSAVALSLCLSCNSAHVENNLEKEAATIAVAWLDYVDAENYAASWQTASTYFQGVVPEKTWVESLSSVRKPLGEMVSRHVKHTQHTKSVSGAPDGDYVIMQFDTSFENKKSAIETVTFMRDSDRKWKAAGYYIK